MLCALQMKYHPSLHANLSVVTGVPSCIREVLLCALGLLFNFFMQLFGGKSDAVCIADEVSSMFSSKLSIACLQLRHYHLRSFTVCVWWTVCPLSSVSCGIRCLSCVDNLLRSIDCILCGWSCSWSAPPAWWVCDVVLGDILCNDVTVQPFWGVETSQQLCFTILWTVVFVGCSHCLFCVQSDGTLFIRRVGCRSHGWAIEMVKVCDGYNRWI